MPSVPWGAYGCETADYAPFLSLPMSTTEISKFKRLSITRKECRLYSLQGLADKCLLCLNCSGLFSISQTKKKKRNHVPLTRTSTDPFEFHWHRLAADYSLSNCIRLSHHFVSRDTTAISGLHRTCTMHLEAAAECMGAEFNPFKPLVTPLLCQYYFVAIGCLQWLKVNPGEIWLYRHYQPPVCTRGPHSTLKLMEHEAHEVNSGKSPYGRVNKWWNLRLACYSFAPTPLIAVEAQTTCLRDVPIMWGDISHLHPERGRQRSQY